jgi:hypothetical protein
MQPLLTESPPPHHLPPAGVESQYTVGVEGSSRNMVVAAASKDVFAEMLRAQGDGGTVCGGYRCRCSCDSQPNKLGALSVGALAAAQAHTIACLLVASVSACVTADVCHGFATAMQSQFLMTFTCGASIVAARTQPRCCACTAARAPGMRSGAAGAHAEHLALRLLHRLR